MTQTKHSFKKTVPQDVALDYLLYLPDGYDESNRYPLILFLHGAGERGDDLDLLKLQGIPRRLAEGRGLPFIVVSPQCPLNESWVPFRDGLIALVDEIVVNYAVDKKRVYPTGLSMGGFGTFEVARRHPTRFAAVAPICGGLHILVDPGMTAQVLKGLPIWVFHGAKDDTVPVESSQVVVDALKAAGSSVKFTVYPNADHDSWTETYDNPDFYDWLLQHTL
jgi:predicted peptidase